MKNFKLLLATTAILSIGAISVKAEDEPQTTTLRVDAELVVVDSIIPMQNIDFGTFILDVEDVEQAFTATMDSASGDITYKDNNRVYAGRKNGQVKIAMNASSKKTIQLPSTIYLDDLDSSNWMEFTPSSVQIDTYQQAGYITRTYGIGGILNSNYLGAKAGKYTGELTVTVIADPGE